VTDYAPAPTTERTPAKRDEPARGPGPSKPAGGPKKIALEPPTLEYLLDLRREGKALYRSQDEQIRVMREVRELLDPVPIDEDWRLVKVEVRVPILTDNVQRTVAILGVNPPDLQVKPSQEDDDAQENATKRERATEGILEAAGKSEVAPPTYLMSIDSAVADGAAWTKLVCRWDDWDEVYAVDYSEYSDDPYPERREGEDSDAYAKRLTRVKTKDQKYAEARSDAKRRCGVPFRWVQVDVATLYPFFGDGRIREVLESTRRPSSQCFRQYRLKKGKDGRILRSDQADRTRRGYEAPKTSNLAVVPDELGQGASEEEIQKLEAGSTVEFLEHWDNTWVTYAVVGQTGEGKDTGQIVDQWEHGYGRHPYFFAPGIWMNHWKNRKIGWGVSESMRWLVKYLSFLLTVHANVAARDVFTPLQEVLPDQAAPLMGLNDAPKSKSPEPEKWQLGRIYRSTRPGSELRPIRFGEMAQELKEQVKIVMDLIDQLLTPRVASQIGGNMEGAGFAISQVLAEGRIRHDPVAQGIERMLTDVTEFLWHLIKTKVNEDVWVGTDTGDTAPYESLGPADLDSAVRIIWTVNAETPSAELLRARYWGERLANHTASQDQAIEGMGDNPDEVRFGLLMDRIRAHPAYMAWQEQMVFEEAERGDILANFKQSQAETAMMTGAVPGPGGAPPPPGSSLPPNVPDTGVLASSPGGVLASPIPGPMGTAPGVGPGATMPGQAARAQVQNLGSPGG
jgi:hypothetical protein